MTIERYCSGLELRAEGRRLVGPAIRYGEVSPSHRERFEAGAFNLSDGRTRWLDVGHDRERVIAHTDGGGLELRDTPDALMIHATLPRIPAADRALEAVQGGTLRGFSIEFHAEAERREGGLRVVERAVLAGVGLVADPSYTGSLAEVRAGGAHGFMPMNSEVDCECHDRGTREARGACKLVIKSIEIPKNKDVLAIAGRYSRAFASLKRGSLTLTTRTAAEIAKLPIELVKLPGKVQKGVAVGMSAVIGPAGLATAAGRELQAMNEVVPVYARPVFDQSQSDYVEGPAGGVVVYDRMYLRAVLFGPTDNAEGWPEVAFGAAGSAKPGRVPKVPIIPKHSRRVRRWQ